MGPNFAYRKKCPIFSFLLFYPKLPILPMVQLVKIGSASPFYNLVEALMCSAFPVCESRTDLHQRQVTDSVAAFSCYAIIDEQTFVGFVTTWNFGSFVYVEHFAIAQEFRGRHLGSQVMEQVLQCGKPVVLEVELPTNAIAVRRVEFYGRLGFVAWKSSAYSQPSYRPKGEPVPMLIMAHGKIAESENFEQVRWTLYREVYGVE